MERRYFILTQTKEFRRHTRLFLKDKDNKFHTVPVTFTTEHKISEKERNKNARKIPAEFSTTDEKIIDALYRSPAYGKTFVDKEDPKGKLKRASFDLTPIDAKRIAMANMFELAGLEFDDKKSTEILEEEYKIFMNSKTGKNVKDSGPTLIPHKPVDVEAELKQQMVNAAKTYEEKYGEPVPSDFANDKAFLSALSDPGFDAKAYMEKINASKENINEDELERLQKEYQEKFGANVPNPKKKDAAWIKAKIAE